MFRWAFLELLHDLVDLMLIDFLHVVRDVDFASSIRLVLASRRFAGAG